MSAYNNSPVTIEAARAALSFISSADRDTWWRIGMALKSEFDDAGWELFETWSEAADNFDAKAAKSVWTGIKPDGGVTIATLIREAKAGGFNPRDHAPAEPLSVADKERNRRERVSREKVAALDRANKQAAAAEAATAVWAGAAKSGRSAYLGRKDVVGHGVRYAAGGVLLVPLRDEIGKLWNVQRILPEGSKFFLKNGRVSGCYHIIGDVSAAAWLLIAEGYATAATLHKETGYAVAVAFNQANIRHVAATMRSLHPAARLLICADDDSETEARTGKNPGIVAATAAAEAVCGFWCKPYGLPADKSDYNDLAAALGGAAVREQIAVAVSAACGADVPASLSPVHKIDLVVFEDDGAIREPRADTGSGFRSCIADGFDGILERYRISTVKVFEDAREYHRSILSAPPSPKVPHAGPKSVKQIKLATANIRREQPTTVAVVVDPAVVLASTEALQADRKIISIDKGEAAGNPDELPQSTAAEKQPRPQVGKRRAKGAATNTNVSGGGRAFFTIDDGGVWFHGFSQQGDVLPAQWICSPLHVVAQSRDAANGEWGYLLEFADADGNPKRWAMPASMLAGDGTQYRATLLGMGLRIGAGVTAKNQLTVYIQTEKTDKRVRCTDRIGWHDGQYVLPDRTIGDSNEMVMFQAAGGVVSQFKQRGTLEQWKLEVAAHCRGNSRMLFCVSAAFAAPLLHLARIPSGGFHIWGDSSSGKSTAFKVAGSVFGGKDYPRNWRMTDNALETVAAQHSDALLLLDEIAQVDPKVVGDTVYMLANETGKGRATQTATARRVAIWRLLFLSDGEISLANHMEQAGKGTKAGHDVRMAHIPADAGCGLGVYDTLHEFANGAAMSDHLVNMANLHYGTAGLAFIEYAVMYVEMLSDGLASRVAGIAAEMCPANSHGQVSRVATRFALVGEAGEIATRAGVTGWGAGEATAAARTCFAAWLEGRGGAGNVEHVSILQQVSSFFQLHGEARFVSWHRATDDHKPNTINRAGFRRMLTSEGAPINSNSDHHKAYGDVVHPMDAGEIEQEYFVLPEVFRKEICKGFNPLSVTRLLIERGLLVTEKGSATRNERLPGLGKVRCYRFKPGIVGIDA